MSICTDIDYNRHIQIKLRPMGFCLCNNSNIITVNVKNRRKEIVIRLKVSIHNQFFSVGQPVIQEICSINVGSKTIYLRVVSHCGLSIDYLWVCKKKKEGELSVSICMIDRVREIKGLLSKTEWDNLVKYTSICAVIISKQMGIQPIRVKE